MVPKIPALKKICSVEECDRKSESLGFCDMHYQRFKKHGDPTVNLNVKPVRYCSVEGCESKFYCKNLCVKHYARLRSHGDPLKVTRQEKTKCTVEQCDLMQHANGYCSSHLYRFQRYGNPLIDGPGRHSGRKRMDQPSYAGMHKRLFYDRGKASAHQCVDCGSQAQEWSYDGGCPNEIFEVLVIEPVPYTTDQTKYSPRCIKCHRSKDESLNRGRDKAGRFAPGPAMS